ncbi:DUF5134 domain-containing protein [Streptomyces polyrhachis]|uniref:DUF5134 domain-containing protein n=1 Tax=Streptomyces polyrhachis TaxID=1282885 RepID=A0ABW2GCY4_9ACTN
MHGPPLTGWLLVALSASVGTYCLARAASAAGAAERRAAGGDALMGLGMAVMALPAPVSAPRPWAAVALAVVFAGAALHALLGPHRTAAHLHHAVGALAMVYMALCAGTSGGHGPLGPPLLTAALLAYFLAYVLASGVRLVAVGGHAVAAGGWRERPELAAGCRVAMGVGMLAMLLGM